MRLFLSSIFILAQFEVSIVRAGNNNPQCDFEQGRNCYSLAPPKNGPGQPGTLSWKPTRKLAQFKPTSGKYFLRIVDGSNEQYNGRPSSPGQKASIVSRDSVRRAGTYFIDFDFFLQGRDYGSLRVFVLGQRKTKIWSHHRETNSWERVHQSVALQKGDKIAFQFTRGNGQEIGKVGIDDFYVKVDKFRCKEGIASCEDNKCVNGKCKLRCKARKQEPHQYRYTCKCEAEYEGNFCEAHKEGMRDEGINPHDIYISIRKSKPKPKAIKQVSRKIRFACWMYIRKRRWECLCGLKKNPMRRELEHYSQHLLQRRSVNFDVCRKLLDCSSCDRYL